MPDFGENSARRDAEAPQNTRPLIDGPDLIRQHRAFDSHSDRKHDLRRPWFDVARNRADDDAARRRVHQHFRHNQRRSTTILFRPADRTEFDEDQIAGLKRSLSGSRRHR
ncbi:protein of unassigned function [Methylobacterium oryzae CBMB20]|uniref:Protein of unassigned function n=1 Tax=Methylobacterium oryzae CBMB20 TaxID=693986 RepID=A0A089P087_9HYPH|nr:protein of unassigned function [Methylobacterium oryzae CBMB20]